MAYFSNPASWADRCSASLPVPLLLSAIMVASTFLVPPAMRPRSSVGDSRSMLAVPLMTSFAFSFIFWLSIFSLPNSVEGKCFCCLVISGLSSVCFGKIIDTPLFLVSGVYSGVSITVVSFCYALTSSGVITDTL